MNNGEQKYLLVAVFQVYGIVLHHSLVGMVLCPCCEPPSLAQSRHQGCPCFAVFSHSPGIFLGVVYPEHCEEQTWKHSDDWPLLFNKHPRLIVKSQWINTFCLRGKLGWFLFLQSTKHFLNDRGVSKGSETSFLDSRNPCQFITSRAYVAIKKCSGVFSLHCLTKLLWKVGTFDGHRLFTNNWLENDKNKHKDVDVGSGATGRRGQGWEE